MENLANSDAFGSGSSPDGHTKQKKPLAGFFSLDISSGREHTRRKSMRKHKKYDRVSVRPIALRWHERFARSCPDGHTKAKKPLAGFFFFGYFNGLNIF